MAGKQAPLGEWESPITSELITAKTLRLGASRLLVDGSATWIEARPTEAGRSVVVFRSPDGTIRDVTPAPDSGVNVRTRVHEYGGGEYLSEPGAVYFSNFADQRVYKQTRHDDGSWGVPEPLTGEGTQLRFADYILDAPRNRLIAVCEDHSNGEEAVANSIAAIDLAHGTVTQLAMSADFYQSPSLSPDGSSLAWIEWDFPNMPWDGTRLMVASVQPGDGRLEPARQVAGGPDTSLQQPQWGPRGELYFISDASGYWNLYCEEAAGKEPTPLAPSTTEYGVPMWVFGAKTYAVMQGGAILAVAGDPEQAGNSLFLLEQPGKSQPLRINTGLSGFGRIDVTEDAASGKLTLLTVAGSAIRPSALVSLTVDGVEGLKASGPADWQVLKASTDIEVDPGYLSEPQSIEFPTEGGVTAFMNFYPPRNKDFSFPPGHKPALLVRIHGGPTAAASTQFSLSYQWWTSRGYAIADVNYGGSTGYGREYRNRLRGNWGIVDVDDCCNAAKHLAEQGLVDPQRLCITGGSAGGYTTLAALAFRDVFSAGASHYGVADTELLAQHTHKFESRYLDLLIGPYPAAKDTYVERSPIHKAEQISVPIALFQGDEDKVVPPEQSVLMYEAVKKRGVPTALVMYKGEQHGFRQAQNIRSAIEGEFYFYGRALGFNATYSPELQPIDIDNLPQPA